MVALRVRSEVVRSRRRGQRRRQLRGRRDARRTRRSRWLGGLLAWTSGWCRLLRLLQRRLHAWPGGVWLVNACGRRPVGGCRRRVGGRTGIGGRSWIGREGQMSGWGGGGGGRGARPMVGGSVHPKASGERRVAASVQPTGRGPSEDGRWRQRRRSSVRQRLRLRRQVRLIVARVVQVVRRRMRGNSRCRSWQRRWRRWQRRWQRCWLRRRRRRRRWRPLRRLRLQLRWQWCGRRGLWRRGAGHPR